MAQTDAQSAMYELLFADRLEAFAEGMREVVPALFAEPADPSAVRAIADDGSAESRLRVLAYRRLAAMSRAIGEGSSGGRTTAPPDLPLLGVIVEIGLDEGLDVLAVYADGRIRYLNHAGGMTVVEGDPAFEPGAKALLAAAEPVARAIGPWEELRRPQPGKGVLRLTFLVGGEIRFGEGPIEALSADPMGGPVFQAATNLLVALVERQNTQPSQSTGGASPR